LESKYPGVVKKLTAAMRGYIMNGRSTPGKKQKNETTGGWKQTILFYENTNN
jgi:hypothetical protein